MPGLDIVFFGTNPLANIGEGSSGNHPESLVFRPKVAHPFNDGTLFGFEYVVG